jgi:hypothetical protein
MAATIDFSLDEHTLRTRMAVVEVWFGGRFVARICSGATSAGAQQITIVTEHRLDVHQEDDGVMRQVLCTIDPTD